jgi:hypothetical protein
LLRGRELSDSRKVIEEGAAFLLSNDMYGPPIVLRVLQKRSE